jgi:SAM-dependent methyltransferase
MLIEFLRRLSHNMRFENSASYWENRYAEGGNSGVGSYNKLAEFKAKIINSFVLDQVIQTVIEFGCGDGNQLSLANYPDYIGFDVSPTALQMCRNKFSNDATKQFRLMDEYNGETAELSLSLDVLYHLIETNVYTMYLRRLFHSSKRYVIIYANDCNGKPDGHVYYRKFTDYIADNFHEWRLSQHIPNEYPYDEKHDPNLTSASDFYIFEKC